MQPRNLYQRSRLPRHVAYFFLALIILSVAVNKALLIFFGVMYCLVFPLGMDYALRLLDGRGKLIFIPLLVENLLTALLTGILSLPPIACLAVFTVLLSGHASQWGCKWVCSVVFTIVTGWIMGFLLSPVDELNASHFWLTWILSATMILGFTTMFSALGFWQTMRMYRQRQHLDEKSRELAVINTKLAKYLAPQVYMRLFSNKEGNIPLSRKWLTVCFIDLVGFTALTNSLSPEELAQILNDFMSKMAQLTADYQGTIDKFVGDGLLVFFGDAQNSNRHDDALRGLELGKAAQKAMLELSSVWNSYGVSRRIGVRVGIASGFCTVGDFGQGTRLDYTVLGSAVNLASRLQHLLADEGIVISDVTRLLINENEQFNVVRGAELKDFPRQLAYILA
ncbi:MAG: adenylate/guanylate cyclase domain-containing protein [Pseudomonadales bacterium]|nr:adenylate/guanylate cyclase domain-containing protein [Pseudomonadales bacterium]